MDRAQQFCHGEREIENERGSEGREQARERERARQSNSGSPLMRVDGWARGGAMPEHGHHAPCVTWAGRPQRHALFQNLKELTKTTAKIQLKHQSSSLRNS